AARHVRRTHTYQRPPPSGAAGVDRSLQVGVRDGGLDGQCSRPRAISGTRRPVGSRRDHMDPVGAGSGSPGRALVLPGPTPDLRLTGPSVRTVLTGGLRGARWEDAVRRHWSSVALWGSPLGRR